MADPNAPTTPDPKKQIVELEKKLKAAHAEVEKLHEERRDTKSELDSKDAELAAAAQARRELTETIEAQNGLIAELKLEAGTERPASSEEIARIRELEAQVDERDRKLVVIAGQRDEYIQAHRKAAIEVEKLQEASANFHLAYADRLAPTDDVLTIPALPARIDYVLEPDGHGGFAPNPTVKAQEGDGFAFHGAITFAQDNGYQLDAIVSRANSIVMQALAPRRIGIDALTGQPQFLGFPKFDPSRALHVALWLD